MKPTGTLRNPAMPCIAIVEDNPVVRAGLEELINSLPDCECVGAFDSGEEALRFIPRLKPDLVMMDIHLPNLSGIECTLKLKETMPDLAVLILTVYEDEEKIFQALQAGASVMEKCVLDKLMPPAPPLRTPGSCPAGRTTRASGSGTRCSWSIC
jgi:CheY-like chemotaxis protein